MSLQWPIESLVPHGGPMVLISEPAGYGKNWAEASVRIAEDTLFYELGRGVPSWVGLEYMAQTIALYAGICDKTAGRDVKVGLLVGTRRYTVSSEYFPLGSQLQVHVDEVWQDSQMAVFDCRIDCGKCLAEGKLNVYQPANVAAFLET